MAVCTGRGLGLACTPRPLPCLLVLLGTKRLRSHDGAVTGLSWAAVEVLVQMPDSRAVGETDRPAPASASGVLDYRCAQPSMPDAGLRKEGPSLALAWKSAQPSARNRVGHTGSWACLSEVWPYDSVSLKAAQDGTRVSFRALKTISSSPLWVALLKDFTVLLLHDSRKDRPAPGLCHL